MSPVINLSDLPGNQPAPMGLVQIKRGAVEGSIVWNNTYPAQPLQDGGGQPMLIAITPTRPGWWVIHAQSMWVVDDGIWVSWEWGVYLNRTDADGRQLHRLQLSRHGACSWIRSCVDCAYRLDAGVYYDAHMRWLSSAGYNQRYHVHPRFHYIEGEFIGEGSI